MPPALVPLVSVLLPVRDGGAFLPSAVASILRQEGVPFELILVDDGSTDGSRAWMAALGDARVRLLTQSALGLVPALNRGLAAARGLYLARMDADDVAQPDRLRAQVAYLEQHPDVGALFTDADYIDAQDRLTGRERGRQVDETRVQAGLLYQRHRPVLIHPSVMLRTAVLRDVGGYRDYPAAEDADLWLRLSSRTKMRQLGQPLLRYRRLDRSVSRQRRPEQLTNSTLAAVNALVATASGIDLYAHRPAAWATSQKWLRQRTLPVLQGEALRLELARYWHARHFTALPLLTLRLLGRVRNLNWLHRCKTRALRRIVEREVAFQLDTLTAHL